MKFNLLKCAVALLLAFSSIGAVAQTNTVSGVVTDAKSNEPVAGVAIMVKGTTTGTMTEANGSYVIKAKPGDVLLFQFFGYKNVEATVDGRSNIINVAIEEDALVLDATVVVGYGTLKKTQLVGSVENLSGDAIEDRPNANVTRSLQGQVAGLNIIQTDGKASHSGKIYVRGNATSYYSRTNFNSSASGSSHSIGNGGSALVLIDGVEGDLNTVNPADVETVAVLKDASSAAIYGAKGCYGVILVTTKNAEGEKFSVSYNGSYSLNTRAIKWEDNIVTDGLEWLEAFYEFYGADSQVPGASGKVPTTLNTTDVAVSDGSYLDLVRATRQMEADGTIPHSDYLGLGKNGQFLYNGNTNWLGMFYKRYNSSTTHDINVKGSTKRLSFSLAGRYFTQGGNLQNRRGQV